MVVEAAIGIATLVYAAVVLGFSGRYAFEARVFPIVVGGAGIVMAVIYLLDVRRRWAAKAEAAAEPVAAPGERSRLAFFLGSTLGSMAFVYVFGVYAYTLVYPALFLRYFSGYAWRAAVLFGVVSFVFVYAMFSVLLDAPLNRVGLVLDLMR